MNHDALTEKDCPPGRLLQQGFLPDVTGRATHYERVPWTMVADGWCCLTVGGLVPLVPGWWWPMMDGRGHCGGTRVRCGGIRRQGR